jgi:RNA polymerase sigma-70 factor (ECF subfamily)
MAEHDPNTQMRDFTRLWLENQHVVSGYIYLSVRDFHHAEDVIQDTARSAVDSFAGYDPARPFAAWAIAIARQRIADHFRKQGRRQPAISSEAVDALGAACAEVAQEADERLHALRQCMAKLTGRHREVVELRYGKSYSPDKIADRLGLKPNAVNALVFRARKALAQCVNQQMRRQDA